MQHTFGAASVRLKVPDASVTYVTCEGLISEAERRYWCSTQLSAAVGRPVCFCEYFGLGSFSQYHVDNISDQEEAITCARHGVHDSGHQISADPVQVVRDISVNARQANATARRCSDGAGARFNDRQIARLEQTAPGRHCMPCARRSWSGPEEMCRSEETKLPIARVWHLRTTQNRGGTMLLGGGIQSSKGTVRRSPQSKAGIGRRFAGDVL